MTSFYNVLPIVLFTFIAVSCQKETVDISRGEKSSYVWVTFFAHKKGSECVPLGLICWRDLRDMTPHEFRAYSSLLSGTDEFVLKPELSGEDTLVLSGEVALENLSAQVKSMLLEKRIFENTQDWVVEEELVRAAFRNAGKRYEGQNFVVPRGTYPISVEGNNAGTPAARDVIFIFEVTKKGFYFAIIIK